MKGLTKYLGLAAAALALTLTAAAEDTAKGAASQFVGAEAKLQTPLNAETAKQGDTVTAKLSQTIHLNGTTLPKNTLLIGHVDQAQPSQNKGVAKVVLTFDQAKLENGQHVPVKATVIGVYPAGTTLLPPPVTPDLEVDQVATGHGYGLTSKVQDSNSGTLTANGRNFRLTSGTELQFALAPAAAAGSASGN